MFKRFYSKKSGFTLVEIIIAFAVFSLMASMIIQMLNLAVSARRRNNEMQAELGLQEQTLSRIEKDQSLYTSEKGKFSLDFEGLTAVDISYDRLSANADSDLLDLGFYIANVDYKSNGEIEFSPGDGGSGNEGAGSGSGNANTGSGGLSQMARMDTRITGTRGIDYIDIAYVIRDDYNYDVDDPMQVQEGHTRYFFLVYASGGIEPVTLKDEDVPYSQYRLFFYSDELDNAESAKVYIDDAGRKYTKDVYKEAKITKVGYINNFSANRLRENGLQSTDIMNGYGTTYNRYTIELFGDGETNNEIRIGTPFVVNNSVDGGYENKGIRFNGGSAFYLEFEGDPHLTSASFGANGIGYGVGSDYDSAFETGTLYKACPKFEYDFDGSVPEFNPYKYDAYSTYVNIYGAFLPTRHYD